MSLTTSLTESIDKVIETFVENPHKKNLRTILQNYRFKIFLAFSLKINFISELFFDQIFFQEFP